MNRPLLEARLRLSVVNTAQLAYGCLPACEFEGDGGTVGSGNCTWVLSDRAGRVAPLHAALSVTDGAFCLRDVAGLTWMNGATRPLGRGRTVVLRQGDTLRIGCYRIHVLVQEGADGRAGPLQPERATLEDMLGRKDAGLHALLHGPAEAPATLADAIAVDAIRDCPLPRDAVAAPGGSGSELRLAAAPPGEVLQQLDRMLRRLPSCEVRNAH